MNKEIEVLIERLRKSLELTEPLYLIVEDTEDYTYFVSDAIGDAIVHLKRLTTTEKNNAQ
jgi:hypothetical protein